MKIPFNERTLFNENIIPLTDVEYADYAGGHRRGRAGDKHNRPGAECSNTDRVTVRVPIMISSGGTLTRKPPERRALQCNIQDHVRVLRVEDEDKPLLHTARLSLSLFLSLPSFPRRSRFLPRRVLAPFTLFFRAIFTPSPVQLHSYRRGRCCWRGGYKYGSLVGIIAGALNLWIMTHSRGSTRSFNRVEFPPTHTVSLSLSVIQHIDRRGRRDEEC